MPIPLLLILAQATPAPPPQRIDLIAKQCPDSVNGEVVVCGKTDVPRLPLPFERAPGEVVRYKGEAAESDPGACAAVQGGCPVGINLFGMATAAVRLVGKAIDPNSCCDDPEQATSPGRLLRDAAGAFRKKPDKSNRVAIDLDAAPPSLAGRLSP